MTIDESFAIIKNLFTISDLHNSPPTLVMIGTVYEVNEAFIEYTISKGYYKKEYN